ncbi:unnamed protein product, partial [Prorocentrum cordatum]
PGGFPARPRARARARGGRARRRQQAGPAHAMAEPVVFHVIGGKGSGAASEAPKKLEVKPGGENVKVGRASKNELVFRHPGISWNHVELRLTPGDGRGLGRRSRACSPSSLLPPRSVLLAPRSSLRPPSFSLLASFAPFLASSCCCSPPPLLSRRLA